MEALQSGQEVVMNERDETDAQRYQKRAGRGNPGEGPNFAVA
jgi:hypothetical protein